MADHAKLAAALVKAQAAIKDAKKDSTNPFFKSKYADLGSVWEACREALHANGLSVAQFPGYDASGATFVATLRSVLLHESGESLEHTMGTPLTKADAQSVGSAVTYMRRYALAAVVGVVTDDDDGNSAVDRSSGGRTTKRGTGPKETAPAPAPSTPEPPKRAVLTPPGKTWRAKDGTETPIKDMKSDQLVAALTWIKATGNRAEMEQGIADELASRQGE